MHIIAYGSTVQHSVSCLLSESNRFYSAGVLCDELPDKSLGEGHHTLAAHDENDSGEKEGGGEREGVEWSKEGENEAEEMRESKSQVREKEGGNE